MDIILKARDLEIKKITIKEGEEVELVQLKGAIAFDVDFIQEMIANGVKYRAIKTEEVK